MPAQLWWFLIDWWWLWGLEWRRGWVGGVCWGVLRWSGHDPARYTKL